MAKGPLQGALRASIAGPGNCTQNMVATSLRRPSSLPRRPPTHRGDSRMLKRVASIIEQLPLTPRTKSFAVRAAAGGALLVLWTAAVSAQASGTVTGRVTASG